MIKKGGAFMKIRKKAVSLIAVLSLTAAMTVPAFAAEDDVVVLYTNDVHTYIDNHVSYSKVAALKDSMGNAILVDAGDHIQGTAYGGMDKGATIIKLMNAADYDVATMGNHEFDYGMDGCMAAIQAAEFPYVSCNFNHAGSGSVLESYQIVEMSGMKIAFIGITTPETFTSSAPIYFQDANGNYIYEIAGGDDGTALYQAVQGAIDAAREAGADYVIGLGHLGVDPSSEPWRSIDVIANTSGLNAFIDGHSHTTVEQEIVTAKDGSGVVLTQTGSYLDAVGKMTISAGGEISTELLSGEELAGIAPDAEVKALEDEWISEIDARLGEVIGYSEVVFDNYDADGNRLVRKQATNTGDFSADALYYLFDEMGLDVDVAIMNGGGVRNKAVTGELSYLTCKEIHTFGNVACLQTVTGQTILDALEWGAREAQEDGSAENGGFLQVSGVRFEIDLTVPSTVQADESGVWIGGPTGKYRVKNVQVLNSETGTYEPLKLEEKYNLAGYNYIIRNQGDGFAMFKDSVNVLDYVAEDYMVLANYIESFRKNAAGLPTITAADGYSDVNGSGRIQIITSENKAEMRSEAAAADGTYMVAGGDSLWKIASKVYGNGRKWTVLFDANKGMLKHQDLIYAGQVLAVP